MKVWLSKVDGQPIAIVYDGKAVRSAREGCEATEILQSSAKRLQAGQMFRPHVHQHVRRETTGTQEAWVVVSGLVRAELIDLDDSVLAEILLVGGDCLVLLRGGHSMAVVEDTLLYEFKNGPYLGQEADKRWLG